MVCMVNNESLERVRQVLKANTPRPTELLQKLEGKMSYSDIQDAISELLESGEVVLDSERRLRFREKAA